MLSVEAVDFFNAISCLWGMVCDNGVPVAEVRKGFPPSFEYSWADGVKVKKPVDCSGPQYVDYVMSWVEDITNNNSIFPSSPGSSSIYIACMHGYFIPLGIVHICPFCYILSLCNPLDIPFPKDFLATIKQIFTRMFRIIAIIYAHHYNKLEELGQISLTYIDVCVIRAFCLHICDFMSI